MGDLYITLYDDIQITDLEPSTPDNTVVYAIQVRGVDQYGNKGPWSRQLRYEAPQLLPSLESEDYEDGVTGWKMDSNGLVLYENAKVQGDLESFNYTAGSEGWKLNKDGDVELNTGVFKGTVTINGDTEYEEGYDPRDPATWATGNVANNVQIASNTYSPGVSGWAISGDGNVEFNAGSFRGDLLAGTIQIGGPDKFRVDSNGNMWIGNSSFSSAPFRVSNTGALTATSATISGNINASSITAGTLNVDRIPGLPAGQITSGTFSTQRIPNLSADKITSGTIDASVISVTNLNASNINSGTLSANRINGGTLGGVTINVVSTTSLEIFSGSIHIDGLGNSISGLSSVSTTRLIASASGTGSLGAVQVPNATAVSSTSSVAARLDNTGKALRPLSSSKKFKEMISKAPVYENIFDLNPVHYKFIGEDSDRYDYGLIAEDVHTLGIPGLLSFDIKGSPASVNYEIIGLMLVPHVKGLKDKIESLESRIGELENAS